jgi:hypothetical protein
MSSSSAATVLGPDDPAQALPHRGELVFQFVDAPADGVGFGDTGVPLGDQLAVDGFKFGDPCDQLGSVGSFDLGAEVEAEAFAEPVVFGSEPPDFLPGDGQIGAQT